MLQRSFPKSQGAIGGVSLSVWRMLPVDYRWGLGRSGWGSIYCLCSDGSRVRDDGGRDLSSIAGIYWELT